MKATIDRAGRVVIPKELRDQIGLAAGEVDIVVVGAGLRIEVASSDEWSAKHGWLVAGNDEPDPALDDDLVRELRLADQK